MSWLGWLLLAYLYGFLVTFLSSRESAGLDLVRGVFCPVMVPAALLSRVLGW